MTKQDKARLINMARQTLLARIAMWDIVDLGTLPMEYRNAWQGIVTTGQDLERAISDLCGVSILDLVPSELI